MYDMLLARRRIMMAMMAKQSRKAPDMVLLINSTNAGDFSVTTNYGTFMAAKVSDYPYFDTTVTHKLSISDVTFSTGQQISGDSTVREFIVGVESWGTSNTYTNTKELFKAFTNLRSIPASWTGLGGVTNTSYMFFFCTLLTSIPDSWEGLGAVTNASSMFSRCSALTSIPASWEGLGAVTITDNMFSFCSALTNCGTIFTGLAMATNVSYLFNFCRGMLGDIHALYVYLSTKPIAVSDFSLCFRECKQAVGYSSIPASWK